MPNKWKKYARTCTFLSQGLLVPALVMLESTKPGKFVTQSIINELWFKIGKDCTDKYKYTLLENRLQNPGILKAK